MNRAKKTDSYVEINSISINPMVEKNLRENRSFKTSTISSLIILLVGVFGAVFNISSMLEGYYNHLAVYSYALFCTTAFFLMFKYHKKRTSAFTIGALMILFATIIFAFTLWNSSDEIYASLYILLMVFGLGYTPLGNAMHESFIINGGGDSTMLLIVYIFVISLILTYFYISKPKFTVVFALTFPIYMVNVFFSYLEDPSFIFLNIIFWASVFVADRSNAKPTKNHSKSKNKVVTVRSEEGDSPNHILSQSVAVICTIILIITSLFVSVTNHRSSDELKSSVNGLVQSLQELDITKIRDFFIDRFSTDRLEPNSQDWLDFPPGNLSERDVSSPLNITLFNIKTEASGNTYIKGYSGGNYTGSEWAPVSEPDADIKYAAYDLLREQYRVIFDLSQDNSIVVRTPIGINSNLNNSSFQYVPYFSAIPDMMYFRGDSYFKTDAENQNKGLLYDGVVFSSGLSNLSSMFDLISSINIDVDSRYLNYVYSNYLTVPQELSMLYNDFSVYGSRNVYEKVNLAQKYLRENTQYSLSPRKGTQYNDYILNFLYDAKSGFCVHYASAGVMMMRSMGVPARYVEGAIVTEGDFVNLGGVYSADIKERNAHAWVEIFVDNVGWVPVEFTPPYLVAPPQPTTTTPTTTDEPQATTTTPPPTEGTTTPSTTPNPQTSSSSTSSGDESSSPVRETQNSNVNAARIVITIAATILFAIVIILLKRLVVIKLRLRDFGKKNYNLASIRILHHLSKLIEFKDILPQDVKVEFDNALQLARGNFETEKTADFNMLADENDSVSDFTRVVHLAQKAKFGNVAITSNEIEFALSVYDKYLAQLKDYFTTAEMISAKFIYNFY